MFENLVRVSANIIAGDGACSAFRVKGKPNGWVCRVRRMYGIKINENLCYKSNTLSWKNDKRS